MKALLKPGSMPRVKPGDYERALQLAATFGSKDAVKDGLKQLRDATAVLDQTRTDVEATMAAATKRDTMAREAETAATLARQSLIDETSSARAELGDREVAVAERERLATEAEESQGLRDKELARREKHLREAGVRGF